jgi:hypothetical protein
MPALYFSHVEYWPHLLVACPLCACVEARGSGRCHTGVAPCVTQLVAEADWSADFVSRSGQQIRSASRPHEDAWAAATWRRDVCYFRP